MPEITAPNRKELMSLSPRELMRRRIQAESELVSFHRQRAAEAEQRQRTYTEEFVKLGGTLGEIEVEHQATN